MMKIDIKKYYNYYKNKKSIKHGLPFICFCVAASFGMREFTEIRYKYRKTETLRTQVANEGIPIKDTKEVTLEAEYEKLKKMDLENWENKRIERPWEK